jgi:hypothetical protein
MILLIVHDVMATFVLAWEDNHAPLQKSFGHVSQISNIISRFRGISTTVQVIPSKQHQCDFDQFSGRIHNGIPDWILEVVCSDFIRQQVMHEER